MSSRDTPKDQFTIDRGDGNGYTVFYQRGHGCFYYEVTYNDNGCRNYSRTRRIPREIYNKEKAAAEGRKQQA
jgi:hypothetical protein